MRKNRKRQPDIVLRPLVVFATSVLLVIWPLTSVSFLTPTSNFISEVQFGHHFSSDGMVSPRWPWREMMNPSDNLQSIHVIFNGSKIDDQRRSQNREGIELNDKSSVYKKIRRRVIVGFPFFREFEILRERLETYNEFGMVDCVIVAESLYSHRGKEKHAFLREATMNKKAAYQAPWLNASRFQFKLVSVVDDINMLSEDNLWGQEYQSRRIIEKGLIECAANDDDIIIVSDADEILDEAAMQWFQYKLQHGQVAFVDLRWHLYNKCWLHPMPTHVAVAVTYRTLQYFLMGDPENIRRGADFLSQDLEGLYYFNSEKQTSYAGIHCSWCFGKDYDAFRDKVYNGNPGDGGDLWYNVSFSDQKIEHLMKNGLWFDGNPHGTNVCS
jgi:Glycosyltransferase family 17